MEEPRLKWDVENQSKCHMLLYLRLVGIKKSYQLNKIWCNANSLITYPTLCSVPPYITKITYQLAITFKKNTKYWSMRPKHNAMQYWRTSDILTRIGISLRQLWSLRQRTAVIDDAIIILQSIFLSCFLNIICMPREDQPESITKTIYKIITFNLVFTVSLFLNRWLTSEL